MTLPRVAEQVLLGHLGHLLSKAGAQRFVEAPIVEPTRAFLPVEWQGRLEDVATLLDKLLSLAELDLDAEVVPYDREDDADHPDAVAWFAGIENGVCIFGVDVGIVEDPQQIIAALCHEIAHAWRTHHDLVDPDFDLEERLTDLTCVFLGFGIFTANGADLYRKSGRLEGGYAITETSHRQLGYLRAEELSYLLATQLVARGLDLDGRRRMTRHLETNQREWTEEFSRDLSRRRAGLLRDLGLDTAVGEKAAADIRPGSASAPPGGATRQRKVALRSDPTSDADAEAGGRRHNEGDPVYRVREGLERSFGPAMLGLLVGAIPPLVAESLFSAGDLSRLLPIGCVVGALGGLALAGNRRDRCSGPECDALIPEGSAACSRCGGSVVGRLERRADLSGARDDYYAERRRRARAGEAQRGDLRRGLQDELAAVLAEPGAGNHTAARVDHVEDSDTGLLGVAGEPTSPSGPSSNSRT
jgi:hypothetical protein